jgi:hypothetical protein
VRAAAWPFFLKSRCNFIALDFHYQQWLDGGVPRSRRRRPASSLIRTATLAAVIAAVHGVVVDGAAADPLPSTPFRLRLGGYGELGAAFYDHEANGSRAGGARADRRLELDLTRFVAVLKAETDSGWELEAELEIEHGGTGAAREVENEEFGEFETEIEKGGEVQLEELYLEKTFAGRYQLKLGRFYVGLGHLGTRYRPTDYLAATRSEIETTVVPGQWDELGVSFTAFLGRVRATVQVVNGLDSTGFSSEGWVATGHQGAFEVVRASDLAIVGRVDVTAAPGVELGVAGYAGNTSRDRPKADLVRDCAAAADDEVAPCGYVWAPLTIVEGHAAIARGGVRASALALWGRLGNADVITDRNRRLSNELGVARTPVADTAYGVGVEAGVDVAPWLGLGAARALEPFARLERFDTMASTSAGGFDNPRYQRTVLTAGAALTLAGHLTFKLDAARRWFGSDELRPETTVHAVAGFVY